MRNVRDLLWKRRRYSALEPDEIFLDSQNLPSFDTAHMEGRIERPLSSSVYRVVLGGALLLGLVGLSQTFMLSVVAHDELATWAAENRLSEDSIIAERGLITDRNGVKLATNATASTSALYTAALREYPYGESTAHVVGYVSYPKRDQNGNWYQDETIGIAGIESLYDTTLRGENGTLIVETDARGERASGYVVRAPRAGRDVALSIDADLQEASYKFVKERADASFIGGAAAIMDIHTGELLTLVSYPSFDPTIMSTGIPQETVQSYIDDPRAPFVDRGVVGLYTPGSIVKPFIALAALEERTVTPSTTYVSRGQLVIPNPFNPDKPTIFRDWRAHGAVDMRRAIAVSSDVYFYIVGGGFEGEKGMGVSKIYEHSRKFGFGKKTGFPLEEEPDGVVPNPEWKAKAFDESIWRVGDTYNTSIGQYGWQVTLLQSLRATAALANGGTLLSPVIVKDELASREELNLDPAELKVVLEGMRMAVTEGTATSLALPGLRVAAKTGTAETGVRKEFTNSLVIGYFPYENPKYAFAVIMERSKAGTALGASAVMRNILEWVTLNRPEMAQP
jgi:penicillin-binding protein 2